ncbi:MAG: helix-turn-helix domain-containing protein [Balneolales bacterium]
MSSKYSYFDTSVLDRLKKALHIKTDSELAEFLGVMPTVVANWRSRNRINTTRVISKCESLDIHWLLFGITAEQAGWKSRKPYRMKPELVEKEVAESSMVKDDTESHDEPEENIKRLKALQMESIQLKSKVEALENVIIRMKREQSR